MATAPDDPAIRVHRSSINSSHAADLVKQSTRGSRWRTRGGGREYEDEETKACIKSNAALPPDLVQLVHSGEQVVQVAALLLVCYIAQNVPDSEDLAQAEILTVLEWASKQAYMVQDPLIDNLLPEAKIRMELYQSRGAKGYH